MKNLTYHGACGKSWTQIGNQTGHCGACHLTFSSGYGFDKHQSVVDGKVVCKSPWAMKPVLYPRPDRQTGEPVWGEAPPVSTWEAVAEEMSKPDLENSGGSDATS